VLRNLKSYVKTANIKSVGIRNNFAWHDMAWHDMTWHGTDERGAEQLREHCRPSRLNAARYIGLHSEIRRCDQINGIS
jgi:hypothetical protein